MPHLQAFGAGEGRSAQASRLRNGKAVISRARKIGQKLLWQSVWQYVEVRCDETVWRRDVQAPLWLSRFPHRKPTLCKRRFQVLRAKARLKLPFRVAVIRVIHCPRRSSKFMCRVLTLVRVRFSVQAACSAVAAAHQHQKDVSHCQVIKDGSYQILSKVCILPGCVQQFSRRVMVQGKHALAQVNHQIRWILLLQKSKAHVPDLFPFIMQVCWQTAKRKISEHSQVLEDGEDHFLPFIQARIRKLDFHSEDRGIATGSEVVATGTGCQLRGPSLLFQEGQYGAFTFVTYQAAEVALWFAAVVTKLRGQLPTHRQ
mmetsp:Transcript_55963/g.133815  ORF Transcript_55963/g.133815 Transcript_55963/m.133815 type:complete len:314 (-) Transcript_55963:151-1092(-)